MITSTHQQTIARIINACANYHSASALWEDHCKTHGLRYSVEDWGFVRIGNHFFRLAEGD